MSSTRLESVDISAFAPEPVSILAGAAYQHYVAYRFLAGWVSSADVSPARYDFVSIAASEYKTFSKLWRAFELGFPDRELRDWVISPDSMDAAYGLLTPRSWQEAALQVYVVGGLLDDAQLAITAAVTDVPDVLVSRLTTRRVAEKVLNVLVDEIDSGRYSRDMLAVWGRAVVGDALLAARATLVLPEDVEAALISGVRPEGSMATAIAQINAFQSHLVAEHTLRLDALHLTA